MCDREQAQHKIPLEAWRDR